MLIKFNVNIICYNIMINYYILLELSSQFHMNVWTLLTLYVGGRGSETLVQKWTSTLYCQFFYSSVVFRMSDTTDIDPDPDIQFVIIPGEKSNSEWLVISDLYILHKNKIYKNGTSSWECRYRCCIWIYILIYKYLTINFWNYILIYKYLIITLECLICLRHLFYPQYVTCSPCLFSPSMFLFFLL